MIVGPGYYRKINCMKRSELLILLAILLLGAILRGAYLSEIVHTPDFTHPGIDAHYHDYWARALATGDWSPPKMYADPMIESTPYFRSPGYPYFLALIYRLTGGSYLWVRLIQMLLGLGSCLLAFFFGRRWFGSAVGLIFAGLMSFYWVFIYFEGELLEPSLLVFLALALTYILGLWSERFTLKRALVAGILLGLYALVRQNIIPFGAVVLAWVYWVLREKGELDGFKKGAIAFVLGAALMILPATVRNYVVAHDLVLISSSGGINLYIGNNPSADGCTSIAPEFPRWTSHDYPHIVKAMGDAVGQELTYSEASKMFSRAAINWIKTNPSQAAALTLKKALLFWGPVEVSNEKEDEFERMHYRTLKCTPGNFAMVFSLALVGTMLGFSLFNRRNGDLADRKQYQVFVLVVSFILVYFLTYLPFFVAGRFRVPIIPFLLLLAAITLSRIGGFLKNRDFSGAFPWICVWAAAYGLASVHFVNYQPSLERWHFAQGTGYALVQRNDEAVREFRAAIAADPRSAEAHASLADILRQKGDLDGAIREFRRSLELDPSIGQAHNNFAVALYFKGDYAGAWKEAHLAESRGVNPDPGFLSTLASKLPEPVR